MPDTLTIEGIAVACRIGVTEAERATPQTIHLDVEVAIDAAKAAATDQVKDAVDYATLVQSVRRLAQSRPYRLLETLAEEIASLVLGEAGTPWVRVRVKKRALPGVGYAAVEIERPLRRSAKTGRRRAGRLRRPERAGERRGLSSAALRR